MPSVGWKVGSQASGYSAPFDVNTNIATWTANSGGPVHPDGSINTGANVGDCWRTAVPLSGSFANASWTFQCSIIKTGIGAFGSADGRAIFRLFKSATEDGSSGVTEITSGQLVGSTELVTTSQTDSIYTGTIDAFTVTDEYLFIQVGWEIITAATGMGSGNTIASLRKGTTASYIITSDFTQTPTQTAYLEATDSTSIDGTGPDDVAWASPDFAEAGEGLSSQFINTPFALDEYSDYLNAEGFGFSIDSGATITKITAQLLRRCDGASAVQDDEIYLVVGGSASGSNKSAGAYWSTSWEIAEYEWTSSFPTISEINASNFGFRIAVVNRLGGGEIGFVDQMRIMIEYTTSSSVKLLAILGVGN